MAMNYIPTYKQHKSRVKRFLEWELITEKDCKEKFDELSNHIIAWERRSGDEARRKYYMENMVALVKEIFDLQVRGDLKHPDTGHLVYGNQQPTELPCPKILVQLVGFSIEPLLLSALALQPRERLVLLFSKETEKDRKNPLRDLLRKNGLEVQIDDNIVRNGENICLVDSSNPGDIFRAISEAVGDYKSGEVAVDITGGKKSMVSAAFLIAVIFDYTIYYVDHEEYVGTTPFPGTEFLSKLISPIGLMEIKKQLRDPGEAVIELIDSISGKKRREWFPNG